MIPLILTLTSELPLPALCTGRDVGNTGNTEQKYSLNYFSRYVDTKAKVPEEKYQVMIPK